jgi:hypothetical protein
MNHTSATTLSVSPSEALNCHVVQAPTSLYDICNLSPAARALGDSSRSTRQLSVNLPLAARALCDGSKSTSQPSMNLPLAARALRDSRSTRQRAPGWLRQNAVVHDVPRSFM